MDNKIDKLLLLTAFSCMACDGEIAKEEILLIRGIALVDKLFGDVDIDSELDRMTAEINEKGKNFLSDYLSQLSSSDLSKEDEISILKVAVRMIKADNKIEYSEIKFFKLIRSFMRHLTDNAILEVIPGIDENFLASDINPGCTNLSDDYFNTILIPKFNQISELSKDK